MVCRRRSMSKISYLLHFPRFAESRQPALTREEVLIAPCSMAHFLAISTSSEAIKASTSFNAAAMACVHEGEGQEAQRSVFVQSLILADFHQPENYRFVFVPFWIANTCLSSGDRGRFIGPDNTPC